MDPSEPTTRDSKDGRDRSLSAIAYGKASQVASISTGLIVPGLIGYWLDARWGITPLLTLVGFAVGFSWMIFQLIQLGAGPKKH